MTRPVAQQEGICDYPLFKHYNTLLDRRILDILVKRAVSLPNTFMGLSFHNILSSINGCKMRGGSRRFTFKERGAVRAALRTLMRSGLVYTIKWSRYRYFPSSRAISAYGIAEGTQTMLRRWL